MSTHSPTFKPTEAVTTQQPSPSIEEEQTTTTTTTSSTATNTIINNEDTTTINTDCERRRKYHPTTIQQRICTNSDEYPVLWESSYEMISEYFFATSNECCAAYYTTEGECIVENVCEDMKYYPDMKNGVCIESDDRDAESFDTLEGCVSLLTALFSFCFVFYCHPLSNQYIKQAHSPPIYSLNINIVQHVQTIIG